MILTGNQSFGSRGDDFRDRAMASAIRDRVVHRAVAIEHPGGSYRLKNGPHVRGGQADNDAKRERREARGCDLSPWPRAHHDLDRGQETARLQQPPSFHRLDQPGWGNPR